MAGEYAAELKGRRTDLESRAQDLQNTDFEKARIFLDDFQLRATRALGAYSSTVANTFNYEMKGALLARFQGGVLYLESIEENPAYQSTYPVILPPPPKPTVQGWQPWKVVTAIGAVLGVILTALATVGPSVADKLIEYGRSQAQAELTKVREEREAARVDLEKCNSSLKTTQEPAPTPTRTTPGKK